MFKLLIFPFHSIFLVSQHRDLFLEPPFLRLPLLAIFLFVTLQFHNLDNDSSRWPTKVSSSLRCNDVVVIVVFCGYKCCTIRRWGWGENSGQATLILLSDLRRINKHLLCFILISNDGHGWWFALFQQSFLRTRVFFDNGGSYFRPNGFLKILLRVILKFIKCWKIFWG